MTALADMRHEIGLRRAAGIWRELRDDAVRHLRMRCDDRPGESLCQRRIAVVALRPKREKQHEQSQRHYQRPLERNPPRPSWPPERLTRKPWTHPSASPGSQAREYCYTFDGGND